MAAGRSERIRLNGDVAAAWGVEARWAVSVPLMVSTAACGFPSPAEDYLDKPLDFNELLIANPSSTFCIRIGGDSMAPLLLENDIGVVDRSLTVVDRAIILACLDGEFTVKRYRCKGARAWLQPENPAYPVIHLTAERDFESWGVIWRAVRLF